MRLTVNAGIAGMKKIVVCARFTGDKERYGTKSYLPR